MANSAGRVKESHTRTLAKTVSWRVFATLITSTIVWKVTGHKEIGISVGLLDCAIKLVTYYVHERAWSSFSFGYHAPKTAHFDDSPREYYPDPSYYSDITSINNVEREREHSVV